MRDPWTKEEAYVEFRRQFPKIATPGDTYEYLGFGELCVRAPDGGVHIFDMFDKTVMNLKDNSGFYHFKHLDPIIDHDAWYVEFIRRLYKMMSIHNYNQRDLAFACGIPQSSLSRMFDSRTKIDVAIVVKITDVLGLTDKECKYLFNG